MAKKATVMTTQSVRNSTKGEIIDLGSTVKMVATGQHPYAKEGDEFDMHPKMAKHLKAFGFVTGDIEGEDNDDFDNVNDFDDEQ